MREKAERALLGPSMKRMAIDEEEGAAAEGSAAGGGGAAAGGGSDAPTKAAAHDQKAAKPAAAGGAAAKPTAATAAAAAKGAPFIAVKGFEGAVAGYAFKIGTEGLGYYRDGAAPAGAAPSR